LNKYRPTKYQRKQSLVAVEQLTEYQIH